MVLLWTSSFVRALKRVVGRRAVLREQIELTLRRLQADPSDPVLRVHKLKGELQGTWACKVDYDTRIVFEFTTDPETGNNAILLIDIGSHEEVY